MAKEALTFDELLDIIRDKHTCKNCKYHDVPGYSLLECRNEHSDHYDDWTAPGHTCERWEDRYGHDEVR